MKLRGDIGLRLGIRGRWFIVEHGLEWPEIERIIGSPEGYGSHQEASHWRRLYRVVRDLQV